MDDNIIKNSDKWLGRRGPEEHIAISSRARYARNLPATPFPMRARHEELTGIVEAVEAAALQSNFFKNGMSFDLAAIPLVHRQFLKENHLISFELEKAGPNRYLKLDNSVALAMMINEEDHLRLFSLDAGLQLVPVLNKLIALETSLEQYIDFAYSDQYGFLTACPTNTGTGLRASVLLHLPALALSGKLADAASSFPKHGLTIRGPYGENSENFGDLFQISNEVTLGKSEQEIIEVLTTKVDLLITEEEQGRRTLWEQRQTEMEDLIWRSWGLLTNARLLTTGECVQHLSRLRIGIDRGWFPTLSHSILNKLMIQVQPGHVQLLAPPDFQVEQRRSVRAQFLKNVLLKN